MAATRDRRDAGQEFGGLLRQQPEVSLWEGLSIRPHRIYFGQVNRTLKGGGPVRPGCIEVWVRNDDEFQAAELIDLQIFRSASRDLLLKFDLPCPLFPDQGTRSSPRAHFRAESAAGRLADLCQSQAVYISPAPCRRFRFCETHFCSHLLSSGPEW